MATSNDLYKLVDSAGNSYNIKDNNAVRIDGSNATSAGVSAMINKLTTGAAAPTDNDYYVAQYSGGGSTTTSYHRRPVSALWEYIKGKISSVLGLTASKYNGCSKLLDYGIAYNNTGDSGNGYWYTLAVCNISLDNGKQNDLSVDGLLHIHGASVKNIIGHWAASARITKNSSGDVTFSLKKNTIIMDEALPTGYDFRLAYGKVVDTNLVQFTFHVYIPKGWRCCDFTVVHNSTTGTGRCNVEYKVTQGTGPGLPSQATPAVPTIKIATNADTVDGDHIVVGTIPSSPAANTIYIE